MAAGSAPFNSDMSLVPLANLQWSASSARLRIRFPISSLSAAIKQEAAVASPLPLNPQKSRGRKKEKKVRASPPQFVRMLV